MEFKEVPGYEGLFKVSRCGTLLSVRTGKRLKVTPTKTGYLQVVTKVGGRKGKNVALKIHRAVALTWLENPKNKPYINHLDGDKANNVVSNLEWVTAKENSRHAFDTGLSTPKKRGENSQEKVSLEESEEIKNSVVLGCREFGTRALARKYGVTHNVIRSIIQP